MQKIARSTIFLACAVLLLPLPGQSLDTPCAGSNKGGPAAAPANCGICTFAASTATYTCTGTGTPSSSGKCASGCPSADGKTCATTSIVMAGNAACTTCTVVYDNGVLYCPRAVAATPGPVAVKLTYITKTGQMPTGGLLVQPSSSTPLAITYTLPAGSKITFVDMKKHPVGGIGLSYPLPLPSSANQLVVYDSGEYPGEYQFTISFTKGGVSYISDPTVYNSAPGGGNPPDVQSSGPR